MARGGDGYTMFRDAKPILPATDSPLLSTDVMDYIQDIGTVRTVAGGRIVLK